MRFLSRLSKKIFLLLILGSFGTVNAQTEFDEDQLGAWYMYFYNTTFGESQFGMQGDFQFRYFDEGGDLEQILLRSGFTYRPKNENILFTLGYGNITTGTFGESKDKTHESRIYQEALLNQKFGKRFLVAHRFRFEQRWVQNQDFRTRYRYNLFLNVPFNKTSLEKNAVYLALYNELFINGQKDIGDGREVELFDRNRTYLGLGYSIKNNLRVQFGWMKQTTANVSKGQLQFSAHHSF